LTPLRYAWCDTTRLLPYSKGNSAETQKLTIEHHDAQIGSASDCNSEGHGMLGGVL
jgi:hypothetical protein